MCQFLSFVRTGSGKSTTMYANGSGVLQTSVNFLLNRNEVDAVYIPMIELHENQFHDLLISSVGNITVLYLLQEKPFKLVPKRHKSQL